MSGILLIGPANKRSTLSFKIYTASTFVDTFRPNIVKCCRCWNCFSSIFYIILFPFLLVLVAIALLLTFIGTILGGFLCSCYYSRMEGYALWASILCCPCLGVFSVAHAVSSFFGEMVKVSCGSVKKYCRTISALCCYSKPKR